MIHTWLEELFDTLLFFGLILGSLLFFCLYWEDSYQLHYADFIVEEFLDEASAEGGFSMDEYQNLEQQLRKINEKFEIEFSCTKTVFLPCYARIPKEVLDAYYLKRNIKKEKVIETVWKCPEEKSMENERFQEETNETILAAEDEVPYLPLPEEGSGFSIQAVRSVQKVYEGEALITLCLVTSENGSFYIEAEPMTAWHSGEVLLSVWIDGVEEYAEVSVRCYPRSICCENGHSIPNTKERVAEMEQTGKIQCPYCYLIPEYMQGSQNVIMPELGESLKNMGYYLEVFYLDGHVERITPEHTDWVDTYDENYCGLQNVVVYFRGKQEQLVVVTEGGICKECNNCCTGRNYVDYVNFPYCTECMSQQTLFTGTTSRSEYIQLSSEIMESLIEEGGFWLDAGDIFTIKLRESEELQSVYQMISKKERKEN